MRWKAKPFGTWKRVFAWLPHRIGGEWIWLERYERRFMGDCYEVRALLAARPPVSGGGK